MTNLPARLRKMTDAGLLAVGKIAVIHVQPGREFGEAAEPFVIQLNEARVEWKRRTVLSGPA